MATVSGEVDQFGHVRLGGIGQQLAEQIEARTGYETRMTILGHVQRGGTPTAFDRVLATRFGVAAIDAVHDGAFGTMMALQAGEIVRVPLSAGVGAAQARRPRAVPRGRRSVLRRLMELLTAEDSEDQQRRVAGGLLARGLVAGDRVAMRTSGDAAMLSAVLGALRVAIVPIVLNSGAAAPRARRAAGRRPSRARPRRRAPGRAAAEPADRPGAGAAGPADALHVGHLGHAEGRVVRRARRGRRAGAVRRGGRPVGVRGRRPPPRLLAAAPLGPDPLRCRHPAAGRVGARARTLRRRGRGGRHRRAPADVVVHGAVAPPAPLRPGRPPVARLVPPAGPRRRALPAAAEAGGHRRLPRRLGVGVLRLDRGPVHRLRGRRLARAARHGGPGPTRPAPVDRPRRHHLVRGPTPRPVHLLGRPRRHRRGLADCGRRPGRVLGRRPRPARRRRLPLARRPAGRPHHQRRGQRLPGRGRGRPGVDARSRPGRGVRRRRRALGPAGVRGRGRRRRRSRGDRVRPVTPGRLQVPEVGLPDRRSAPHQHRQGAAQRGGGGPGPRAGPRTPRRAPPGSGSRPGDHLADVGGVVLERDRRRLAVDREPHAVGCRRGWWR